MRFELVLAALSICAASAGAAGKASGPWHLINKGSGLSAGLAPGPYGVRDLVVAAASGAKDQSWSVEDYPPSPGSGAGTRGWLRFKNAAVGFYAGARFQTRYNGCKIATYSDPAVFEEWQLVPDGDGWSHLINRSSKKSLGLKDGRGPQVVQWDKNGSDDQKWKVVSDDGIVLKSDPWPQCLAFCMGCDEEGKCSYLESVRSMELNKAAAFRKLKDECAALASAKGKTSSQIRVGFRDGDPEAEIDSPQVCR